MKFSISLEQRAYLNKKGYVPFHQLLSDAEIDFLIEGIEEALKETKFKGRDLWRLSNSVKKIVFSKRLVDVVYQLTETKPLRLAFDQYILEKGTAPLMSYFEEGVSVQEKSCISSLVGLFLIVLNGKEGPNQLGKGGGYFIASTTSLSPDTFLLDPDQRIFIIGYGDLYSRYLHVPNDPHVHFLKNLGLVFGDRLSDSLHPILLR